MKQFKIRWDEVDDLISRLYEYCTDNKCSFSVFPGDNLIEVFQQGENVQTPIAQIEIITICDAYDIIKELNK